MVLSSIKQTADAYPLLRIAYGLRLRIALSRVLLLLRVSLGGISLLGLRVALRWSALRVALRWVSLRTPNRL